MFTNWKLLISGGLLAFGLTACSSNNQAPDWTKEVIEQTRLCPQMIYQCLPESHSPEFQMRLKAQPDLFYTEFNQDILKIRLRIGLIKKLMQTLHINYQPGDYTEEQEAEAKAKLGLPSLDYETLTLNEIQTAFKTRTDMNYDNVYILTKRETEAIYKQTVMREYKEIVQMLDIYFPGFWGDMPEEDRLKWVNLADEQREKYSEAFGIGQGAIEAMAHICAILGIEWDKDPRNQRLIDFFTKQEYQAGWDSVALTYLYFELLGRDYDFDGNHMNSFTLRGAYGSSGLADRPSRKRPMEAPDSGQYQAKYDLFGIYYYTVREGGKLKADPKDYAEAIAWRETLKPDYRLNRQQEGQRVH